jgi:hypothetical protein
MPTLLVSSLTLAVLWAATPLAAQQGPPVPAHPPDSVPGDLYHDSVMVADSHGLRWSRAVIAVHFTASASQADRRSAIDSIRGAVVGGIALFEDGYYLARVPHDTTLAGVDAALAILRQLSSVKSAMRIAAPLQPAIQPHPR